jgi:hypothetical protein
MEKAAKVILNVDKSYSLERNQQTQFLPKK